MTMKVAYFQPVVVAMDSVPPVQYSKLFNLCEQLHQHPELNDNGDPALSIRGGQQIQIYPNQLNLDVSWLVAWIEQVCLGYMELVTQQSGTIDLTLCKAVVNSIWTIEQGPGDYQEMHSHPGGHLSEIFMLWSLIWQLTVNLRIVKFYLECHRLGMLLNL